MKLPELCEWDQLSETECGVVVKGLTDTLAAPWAFSHIRFCEIGDQRRHVAFFDWNGLKFSLIIGGTVTLGYNRNEPPTLTEGQRRDYEEQSMAVCGYPPLPELLDKRMTPVRQVTIEPFLLEVEAGEASGLEHGVRDIVIADETVLQIGYTRFNHPAPSHRHVLTQVQRHGFRLPTSDEWEHACAAGSRTLWRWGNAPPPFSFGEGHPTWDFEGKPNAFGLFIAKNTNEWEWCTHPDVMRGGDGGVSDCGGEGDIATWLALASPHADPLQDLLGVDFLEKPFFGNVRRAISLDGP